MYRALPLPYDYDALEPIIDKKTVELHYNKHYMNYLNNLNKALEQANFKENIPLTELVQRIDEFPINLREEILFNAGGVLNHNLYFSQFSNKGDNKPSGNLKKQIDDQFGSYENLVNILKEQSKNVRGSGWTFLVLNEQGELEIMNTINQETPYLYGLKPIIAIDLWEHAYYLNYYNDRNKYVDAIFDIMDFDLIQENYEEAKETKTNI